MYPISIFYIYIYLFALFFILIAVFQTVTMVRIIYRVFRYIHSNWTYSSPNTPFVVPPRSLNPTLQVTTVQRSSLPDNIIQTKTLLSPNCTKKLDSSVYINEGSQYLKILAFFSFAEPGTNNNVYDRLQL